MSESPSVHSDTAALTPLTEHVRVLRNDLFSGDIASLELPSPSVFVKILDHVDAQAPDLGKEVSFLFRKLEIVTMHFEADRRVKEAKRLSASGELESLRQEVADLKLKIANLQEETTSTKMKVRAIDCWAAGLKHAAQAPHFGPDVDDGKPQAP
ncbi:hypothetical protein QIS74_12943 [Colletotrichum tabaci]|uniref:Uncharacterized protein n=1 Tax=Colletotrichum tabaci TaxID=1209068 RepID=A0AAV9SXZ4_9PEZI